MPEFEPRIVGFLCNWCSYAGADLAGVSRIQYPPNIRIIRVMCSGRVDPVIVLEMFANGADGVIVTGCHPGDCHYGEGNLHEERRIKMLRGLIAQTGLELGRLRLEWVSAAEGQRFAQVVTEFTEQVKRLGPSPVSGEHPDSRVLGNIRAAENAAADFTLRVLVGRELSLTDKGNVYGEKIAQKDFDALLGETIRAEFVRHKIYLLTKVKPLPVQALAKAVDMKPSALLQQIVAMRRKNMITLDHVEGATPFYRAIEVE